MFLVLLNNVFLGILLKFKNLYIIKNLPQHMKSYLKFFVFFLFFPAIGQVSFNNPVLPGFNPDPSVCRVGEDYYLVTSSFEFFPGVPVYHSKDLVNWEMIGYALSRSSQVDLSGVVASDGIWAPTIRHNNGTFYAITTLVQRNPWKPVNFYVTATDPAGPWSDPIFVDEGGIDPDLFFDEDGKVYYLRNGANGIDIAEIDIATGKLLHEPVNIWAGTGAPYPEAPHMYRVNGMYYLIIGEGGTGLYHRVSVARASAPLNVFKSYAFNPILYHAERFMHPIQAVGHADLVQAHDGTWWAFFLGKRSTGFEVVNSFLGRETFLAPVNWTHDGWPVIGYRGFVEPVMTGPSFFESQENNKPLVYAFDKDTLPLAFNFIRNPVSRNYTLNEKKGWLGLKGTELNLTSLGSPTFSGTRWQHFNATITTKMEFDPKGENEEAGLVFYLDNKHYYSLSVVRQSRKNRVQVKKRVGSLEMTTFPVENAQKTVFFRIVTNSNQCVFLISTDGVKYVEIGQGEASFMHSPGFTGAYAGIFATGNGRSSGSMAWFDWLEYVPGDN
jgi:xylan 1,4-beta-xylosidase